MTCKTVADGVDAIRQLEGQNNEETMINWYTFRLLFIDARSVWYII